MRQVICPLDGKPCEQDCPDRYIDQPEGGCILTTAMELGCSVISLNASPIPKRKGGDLMEKQGLKKVCPLLAIAQAASGQNVQSLAPCIGERCAFCTRAIIHGAEQVNRCALVSIAENLRDIAESL